MARRKLMLILGSAGFVLLLALGLAMDQDREKADGYAWAKVDRGDIRETITASGEIQAKVRVRVGTTVLGEIKTLHVKDGQMVQAGDVLVTLDQERLRQDLRRAEAVLDASRAELRRAQAASTKQDESTGRLEALYAQHLISTEDHRQALLSRDSQRLAAVAARAQLEQVQAAFQATRDGLSKSVLKAPITGRITGLRAEQGETAIPGTSNLPGAVLMVISDMSQLLTEVRVNESEVVRLRPGQPAHVTVEPFPGRVFQGEVAEVATGSERGAGEANLYLVKVALRLNPKESAELRPGMSARAVILTGEARRTLRVPLQAVLERENERGKEDLWSSGLTGQTSRSAVMVYKDGRAVERSVVTGLADSKSYEVKEGLQEGDQVITGPLRKLKELKDRARIQLRLRPDSEAGTKVENPKG